MKARARIASFVLCMAVALAFGLGGAQAFADDAGQALVAGTANMQVQGAATQTLNGQLVTGLPGVYKVVAEPGADKSTSTINIPSVAKQTLADRPTTETPAIIMGAAVNYEKKTGATEYTPIPGAKLLAPYKYFRWKVVDEQLKDADGKITTHKKLSGFDGSYYIVRVDVSKLIEGVENPENKYLHVRQDDNKAMMVATGFNGTTYSNAMGSKTGSYSLANSAAALKDTGADDKDKNTPYFDVIVLSSGKVVAGADAGSSTAPSSDIKLSFYVDDKQDYRPWLKALDPNKMPTFPYTVPDDPDKVSYKDELEYNKALLTKYYDEEKAVSPQNKSSYQVKGSDLEIDVTVDDNDVVGDTPEFWSLTKAMAYQKYDSHTIKLISEVPVLEGLSVASTTGDKRSVILDVNSLDIQIANNTTQKTAGLTIENNAELRIKDGSHTAGAELAIGNNATMVIKKDGVLVIDETCTNEVEYDAATAVDPKTDPSKNLFNGEITIQNGGKVVNYGVINIEGAESKPKQSGQQGQPDTPVVTDMKRSNMFVDYGGQLDNYGTLSLKGDLYVLGTLNNYGQYKDIINAYDPDKGRVAYHKGIQVTWKDVVTEKGVEPGVLNIGKDADGKVEKRAVLNNYGDIVLVPGTLNVYGTFNNLPNPDASLIYSGHLFQCTAEEAIIPVIDPNDPLHVEDRVKVNPPKESVFNQTNGTVNTAEGFMGTAKVALVHNGVLGDMTILSMSMQDKKVVLSKDAFTYNAKVQKPLIQTIGGMKLKEGTDYTVTWSDASSKNAGNYTLTITGKGLYSGKSLATYSIAKAEGSISLASQNKTYTGKALSYSGTVSKGGSTGAVSYKYYSDAKCTKEVKAADVKAVGTYYVKVTMAADATYTAATSAPAKLTIKAKGVTPTVTLAKNTFTYTGKTIKPTLTVKVGSTKLKASDYKVSYYKGTKAIAANNVKAIGSYKVKVTLKGNYAGAKTLAFKVVPGKTKARTVGHFKNRTMDVSYNKVKDATSYVVSYRKAGSSKWITKSAGPKTAYAIKNLKPGFLYEVKVAAKNGSVRGDWSNVSLRYFQKVSSYKVVKGKKRFTASWKGVKTTRYQLRYSTQRNFAKNVKTVNVPGKKSGKVVVKGLKSKKAYYSWVRPVKVYKGKTYYGIYSARKMIRTK